MAQSKSRPAAALPSAIVSHRAGHRLRIRIPERRRSKEFFARLENSLNELEGIEGVQSNPETGSVLIFHHSEPEKILRYGEQKKLFQVREPKTVERIPFRPFSQPVDKPWMAGLGEQLQKLDETLLRKTGGRIDTPSLRTIGLFSLGIYQAYRKQLFPPALTLLDMAIGKLRSFNQRSDSRREHEAA